MPTKIIVNCTTGAQEEVELTGAEIAELDQQRAQYEEDKAQRDAEAEALAELKASAKAKLIAGNKLTEEEADAIL